MGIGLALAGIVAGHLSASLVQTLLHRALGHGVFGGWVRSRHVGEHHSIYSGDRLALPCYSSEEKSLTLFYLLPGALIILSIFLLFPRAFAAGFAVSALLSYFLHIYLHAQYHLTGTQFESLGWFRKLRGLHMMHHHHQNRNFAVIDLYWDKLMGTFAAAPAGDNRDT